MPNKGAFFSPAANTTNTGRREYSYQAFCAAFAAGNFKEFSQNVNDFGTYDTSTLKAQKPKTLKSTLPTTSATWSAEQHAAAASNPATTGGTIVFATYDPDVGSVNARNLHCYFDYKQLFYDEVITQTMKSFSKEPPSQARIKKQAHLLCELADLNPRFTPLSLEHDYVKYLTAVSLHDKDINKQYAALPPLKQQEVIELFENTHNRRGFTWISLLQRLVNVECVHLCGHFVELSLSVFKNRFIEFITPAVLNSLPPDCIPVIYKLLWCEKRNTTLLQTLVHHGLDIRGALHPPPAALSLTMINNIRRIASSEDLTNPGASAASGGPAAASGMASTNAGGLPALGGELVRAFSGLGAASLASDDTGDMRLGDTSLLFRRASLHTGDTAVGPSHGGRRGDRSAAMPSLTQEDIAAMAVAAVHGGSAISPFAPVAPAVPPAYELYSANTGSSTSLAITASQPAASANGGSTATAAAAAAASSSTIPPPPPPPPPLSHSESNLSRSISNVSSRGPPPPPNTIGLQLGNNTSASTFAPPPPVATLPSSSSFLSPSKNDPLQLAPLSAVAAMMNNNPEYTLHHTFTAGGDSAKSIPPQHNTATSAELSLAAMFVPPPPPRPESSPSATGPLPPPHLLPLLAPFNTDSTTASSANHVIAAFPTSSALYSLISSIPSPSAHAHANALPIMSPSSNLSPAGITQHPTTASVPQSSSLPDQLPISDLPAEFFHVDSCLDNFSHSRESLLYLYQRSTRGAYPLMSTLLHALFDLNPYVKYNPHIDLGEEYLTPVTTGNTSASGGSNNNTNDGTVSISGGSNSNTQFGPMTFGTLKSGANASGNFAQLRPLGSPADDNGLDDDDDDDLRHTLIDQTNALSILQHSQFGQFGNGNSSGANKPFPFDSLGIGQNDDMRSAAAYDSLPTTNTPSASTAKKSDHEAALESLASFPFIRPPFPAENDVNYKLALQPSLPMVELVMQLATSFCPNVMQLYNEEGLTPLFKFLEYRRNVISQIPPVHIRDNILILKFLLQQQPLTVNDVHLPLRVLFTVLPSVRGSLKHYKQILRDTLAASSTIPLTHAESGVSYGIASSSSSMTVASSSTTTIPPPPLDSQPLHPSQSAAAPLGTATAPTIAAIPTTIPTTTSTFQLAGMPASASMPNLLLASPSKASQQQSHSQQQQQQQQQHEPSHPFTIGPDDSIATVVAALPAETLYQALHKPAPPQPDPNMLDFPPDFDSDDDPDGPQIVVITSGGQQPSSSVSSPPPPPSNSGTTDPRVGPLPGSVSRETFNGEDSGIAQFNRHPLVAQPRSFYHAQYVQAISSTLALNLSFTGFTPLLYLIASYESRSLSQIDNELLEVLLQNGANPNLTSFNNDTALRLACRHIKISAIALLLQYRACARYNGTYQIMLSPLYQCIQAKCDVRIIQALIHRGAQINRVVVHDSGPLFYAVELLTRQRKTFGETGIQTIQCLLQARANVNEVDQDNETVLMKAVRTKEMINVVRLLVSYGSNLFFMNNQGNTARDLALKEYEDIVSGM